MRPSRAFSRLRLAARSGVRDSNGQSLIEFALVLPLLLLLLLGIVEFASAWRTYQVITNVAREGARLAVIPTSDADTVLARVRNGLDDSGLDPDAATITLDICSGTTCTGTPDEVSISYPYDLGLIGELMTLACTASCADFAGTVDLQTSSTMRNE